MTKKTRPRWPFWRETLLVTAFYGAYLLAMIYLPGLTTY